MKKLRIVTLLIMALMALSLTIDAQTNYKARPKVSTSSRESYSNVYGQADPVPTVYADLYNQLNGDLNDFQAAVNKVSNGATFPVDFAGQLTAANSNNGPKLLNPSSFQLVQEELQLLKTLGVQAVSVEVSFPMLYQPFLGSTYDQYVTYYTNVAAAVRANGFKLIVESQSLIPSGLDSNSFGPQLQTFYPSLNFQQYVAARAATAAVVAQTMKPDFFVLQEEPDTESNQSGQRNLATVAGSTMMLSSTLASVEGLVPGMKVGAGFGTWLAQFQLFANSFTRTGCGSGQPCVDSPMDFLDIHLFPVIEHAADCGPNSPCPPGTANFWQNALSVINTANAANMHMTISQTWLRKTRDSEWPPIGVLGDIEEAREAYSFWAPLDQQLLKIDSDLANYQGMYFVAPFNTQNYSAYIQFSDSTSISGDCGSGSSPCGTLTPAQVFMDVQQAAITALSQNQISSTGLFYQQLIQSQQGGQQDFSLLINPTSQTIAPGASTSFDINVQAIGNFAAPINLSLISNDSGITTSLSSTSIMPGGKATLTVNTTANTTPKTYNITITGMAGQITHSATAMVMVTEPDFSLTFNPATITIARGKTGQFTVDIGRTGGFNGNVTVTAPDADTLKSLKIKLTSPSMQSTTGANVSFNFKAKKKALTGSHQLVFTGQDEMGRVRMATLTLMIQ